MCSYMPDTTQLLGSVETHSRATLTWNAGRSAAAANWRSDARLSRAEGGAWRAASAPTAPVLASCLRQRGLASRLKARAHCRLPVRCTAAAAPASASAARPCSRRAPSRGSRCLSAMLDVPLLPSRRSYALGGLQLGQRAGSAGAHQRAGGRCIALVVCGSLVAMPAARRRRQTRDTRAYRSDPPVRCSPRAGVPPIAIVACL